jgi:PTH2 family peptidyl-tRNA hydrolase
VASKLVIVMRADLGMSVGKVAAQAAHAATAAALAAQGTAGFQRWVDEGQPKVVLRVNSLAGLEEVVRRAEAAALPVELVEDAGRTEVEPGTPTCCAVGPAEAADLDRVTGSLALL